MSMILLVVLAVFLGELAALAAKMGAPYSIAGEYVTTNSPAISAAHPSLRAWLRSTFASFAEASGRDGASVGLQKCTLDDAHGGTMRRPALGSCEDRGTKRTRRSRRPAARTAHGAWIESFGSLVNILKRD